VTDYIIDLRYNGGGLLSIADLMLDLLGGRLADRQRSFFLSHNRWHADYNAYEYFERFSEGQYAFDQPGCDARIRLVSFEVLNGEGEGGYYTGLADTGRFTLCPAADDLSKPFTDPQEDSIRTALDWLKEGACPSEPASQKSPRAWQKREKLPLWIKYVTEPHGAIDPRRH
jgi:carboxyl-terminal processing protease